MDADRIRKHFHQPRSAVGLGMFRIVYSLTLLGEVGQLWYLRELVFDGSPGQMAASFYGTPVFALWMGCILCLVVGLFTRTAAVLNYGMTLLTFSTFRYWEYHVDYIYTGINCFLMFVPVGRAVSVDAWRRTRRLQREGLPTPPPTVPRVYYDALIFVGIALVYWDSVFYKLASPMWLAGLGLWRPASLPHNTYWDVGWLLDLKWLVVGLSYLTLLFECLFLPLMWFDRLRPWLFLIGVGLHLGIVVMFPIPWFGFAVFGLYLLLVPDRWYARLGFGQELPVPTAREFARMRPSQPSESLLVRVVVGLALTVSLLQFVMTSASDLSRQMTARLGGEAVRRSIENVAVQTHGLARTLFGVTRHPVFMDFHFDNYESFYTLVFIDEEGTRTWLPMAAETGQGALGWSGRLWVNWTWRVSNPAPDPAMLETGFVRVTRWWLENHGRNLDDATFLVMQRACDRCDGWRQGYYQSQLDHRWEQVGRARWREGEFDLSLNSGAVSSSAANTRR